MIDSGVRFPEHYWTIIFRELESEARDTEAPSVSGLSRRVRDPFRVLVATIISLRTRDEVTRTASERLFARADNPESVLEMDENTLARLIYPAGFYRTKARTILTVTRILVEQHNGHVPNTVDALTALPGVGRKTANLVLNLGFGIPAICVDTHVHRISNRFGWVATRTPDKTEAALERVVPREYWIAMNELLVGYGQRVCTPMSPWCSRCPFSRPEVATRCEQVGVDRRR